MSESRRPWPPADQATLRRMARQERASIIAMDFEREVFEAEMPWCARCSPATPHPYRVMTFTAFANPVEDTDGTSWTYWGLCPVSGDPVLLKQEDGVG